MGRCANPGMTLAIIVAVLAGCGGDDSIVVAPPKDGPSTTGAGSDRCHVGAMSATSTAPPGTEVLVLHCGRLPGGRDLEVIGYRESGRVFTGVWLPPRGFGYVGAGDLLPGRDIEIQGHGTVDRYRTMVSGKASLSVGAVAARLGPKAKSERRAAELVRIAQPQLLQRLRVNRPFGYYFVVVPTAALRSPGNVVIEARDQRGDVLDEEVLEPRIAG